MKIQAKPWSNIADFYQDMPETLRPMRLLVQHIMSEGYDAGLFPYTSMHQLRLSRTSYREWCDCELSIELKNKGDSALFQYWEHPHLCKPSWSAEHNSSNITQAFDRVVIKRLRWFKEIG